MSKPSILMTFAANNLSGVTTEAEKIWASVSKNELITPQKIENTDINALAEAIIDSKDLWFFHFGGHASGGEIVLDGFKDLKKAKFANLLLPEHHKMQVVFLNGCLSQGQVGILTARGVKAVIATNTKVNDSEAVRLAKFFYKCFFEKNYSLKSAFESAEATIEGDNAFVTIVNPGGIDETNLQASPWTLFINAEYTEVMNWKLGDFIKAIDSSTQPDSNTSGNNANINGNGNVVIQGSNNSNISINTPSTSSFSLSEIQKLISSNKLDKALDLMLTSIPSDDEDTKNTIILLQGRFTRFKRDEMLGIISSSDANLERNKITAALLAIASDL